MTHNDAYNIGWKDYKRGVSFTNPPEDVMDTQMLEWNWQRGWLEHQELDT